MPDQFISTLNNIENPSTVTPEYLGNQQEIVPPETEKATSEKSATIVPPEDTAENIKEKPPVIDATTPEISTKDISGDKNTNIANELEKELITTIHNLPNDKS